MTLVLGLIAVIPLGWYLPRMGHARLGGLVGAAIGVAAALILGFAAIFVLAQAVAALRGSEAKLEFEAGLNAWKLLILLAPASALNVRRQARRERGEDEGDGA